VIFRLYNCDIGIKYNGQSYDFTHVNSVTIEDPENTKLTRGANASNRDGIIYRDGVKDAKKITTVIMGMSPELKQVLDQAFANQDRLDFYCISRNDGSSKMARNAILCQIPQQLTLDDGAESMNVSLVFESFDLTEVHKS
jgi:hypothetical protein